MEIADEELRRRRRERGRRSQAAFRKRQAQAARDQIDQSRRLKDGIEDLLNATKGDERPELLGAIQKLAEAAGISTVTEESCESRPTSEERGDCSSSDMISSDMSHMQPCQPTLFDLALPSAKPTSKSFALGVWLDPLRFTRQPTAPIDILPYLGKGSDSFAGRLFWATMEHSQGGCTINHPHLDVDKTINMSLKHSRVTEEFSLEFIKAMAGARLDYKRTGFISADYGASAEADLAMVVLERVKKDYRDRGKDIAVWLTSKAIEDHLVRRMVGGRVGFEKLDGAARGQGLIPLRDLYQRVQCQLIDMAVCFGDGPRWHIDVVDGFFGEWIEEASILL